MSLALIVAECEDEMICDMAETYHVLDWRALRPSLAATLAIGLPESSRVMRKLRGDGMGLDTMLHAAILDQLRISNWLQTKDGLEGKNRPRSVLDALTGKPKKREVRYMDPTEFEARRQAIMGEDNGG